MASSQTAPSRCTNVLRWAGVIPGALIAVLVVMFPIHWFVMLQYIHNDEGNLSWLISPRTLEMLTNAFFTPFIFIAAGSAIAPRYKLATGIVLALLLVPLYVWFATLVLGDIHQGLYTMARWFRLGITAILCIAGFAFGLRQAKKGQSEMAMGQ